MLGFMTRETAGHDKAMAMGLRSGAPKQGSASFPEAHDLQ